MNVYVLNSARQLARRGIEVDVYTRATRPSQGEIIEVEPHLRVINIVAGPYEGLDKEDLPTQLAAFAGGMVQFAKWQGKNMTLFTPTTGSPARWAGCYGISGAFRSSTRPIPSPR